MDTGEYGVDILGKSPKDTWHWVRGRVLADIDGVKDDAGRATDEEVLLVTRQRGNNKSPGPAIDAWVCLVDINPINRRRTLRARHEVYSVNRDMTEIPMPEYSLGVWTDGPVEDGRVQVADLDADGKQEVLVQVWRPVTEGVAAILYVFRVENENLVPVFNCRAIQPEAEIQHHDADKDGIDEILIPAAFLPPTPENSPRTRAAWLSVYSRGKDGLYQQADARFASLYDETRLQLLEGLALQSLDGNPAPLHCFYLGLIYKFKDDKAMMQRFMQSAAKGPGRAARMANSILGSASPAEKETGKMPEIKPPPAAPPAVEENGGAPEPASKKAQIMKPGGGPEL